MANIKDFPADLECLATDKTSELTDDLMADYTKNKRLYTRVSAGITTVFDSFYPAESKLIIDKIDQYFAMHYGFPEKELDFIINYDYKYRMGNEEE
jgi:hypothetical protein